MFRTPWSGDVAQRITAPWFSPSLTVNYAGDPAVEDRVVTEVASYGKQLGWLTEIAIALAKTQPVSAETLGRLEKAAKDIAVIKEQVGVSAVEAANDALDRLEKVDAELAKIVELRAFGGLTIEEAAHVLRVSPSTVKRDWRTAKAWLNRELGSEVRP